MFSIFVLHLQQSLVETGIGDLGCRNIADGIAANESLKNLGLGANKIGPEGCEVICKAILKNHELEKLEMCKIK